MYSDDATVGNVDSLIEKYKRTIEELENVKKQLEELKKVEVAIRTRDNQMVYVEYMVETVGAVKIMVKVFRLPPGGSSDYIRIPLEDFQKDYIEYTKKTRIVMPKF
jgi:hypothetical protein